MNYHIKMSRSRSTERCLFGGSDTNIWVTQPTIIHFEKGDTKFILKLVEFDYDNPEDHVLMDISANGETDILQTGVNVFKQNEFTSKITQYLKMDKRELFRHIGVHRSRDVAILGLVKALQAFTFGV